MQAFASKWEVLLTTFCRNGASIGTPVNLAVEDDHGYFRTYSRASKLKRIRRNPNGQITPCSPRGKATGPGVPCRIRILDGPEATHAERAIKHKHPLVQGVLVSVAHTLMRDRSVYLEVRPRLS
jgi:uncharacterized protein